LALPDFPWDSLAAAKATAARHADGLVDLSVGTPVDPTPEVVQHALQAAADAPGYPTTSGSQQLREHIAAHLARSAGSIPLEPDAVLPTIGSKELVAWLPRLLGLGAGDTVVIPELAYPTYEVGARLAGCEVLRSDGTASLGPRRVALLWINTPANPHGKVLPVEHLKKVVSWARERGTLLVSDECYLPFGWDAPALSVLGPAVNGGSVEGLLAVHSLSKRSNMAGYRAGFVAGDPDVVGALLQVRKHAGMMVPQPVQAALLAAVDDDAHVHEQVQRYRRRRDTLAPALTAAGFRIDHSGGGLYLWCSRDEPCRTTVDRLADRGILVAPGDFYGPKGAQHVRVALTASDERIQAAASRLAG
jgi:succinyldiaminopimelate transaminase